MSAPVTDERDVRDASVIRGAAQREADVSAGITTEAWSMM